MRYTEHITITNFENHIADSVGEQYTLTPFGHGLDTLLREMAVTLWYDDQSRPDNPDPKGWLAFQLVQPNLRLSEVRAYPAGYTVIAQSARIPFRDIVEFGVIRVRGQGGSIRYLEPLFLVAQGYKSNGSYHAVWAGLESATVTLHYRDTEVTNESYQRDGPQPFPARQILGF